MAAVVGKERAMKKTPKQRHKIFRNGKPTAHDSIFVTEHLEPETLDEAIELHSFDSFILQVEKIAEKTLVNAKLWPHPNHKLLRLVAAIETSKCAPEDSAEYFSACVIWWICNLRDAINRNDARAAADAAYRVADSANNALIAKMELNIVVGGKSVSAGNNDKNKALHAAAMGRDERVLKMVKQKKDANPKETDRSIANLDPYVKPDTKRKRIERARKRLQKP